ncbi:DUF2235 domain-containing protein [Salinisphaera aquimarina]|uniref:DUF2235 domain-containing protein n=1 Tax=Salinisphaera aquimarina TaxID=2094031 RepID=A0ABV7ESG6_9GAMM
MRKDIVVCCDGTNSQFGKLNTNVAHAYNALPSDDPRQVAFYEPGVGTFGARVFGLNVGETLGKALGAAFGYGMRHNLVQAYRFVIDVYEPGDRLFIFGFSRGAFTARILAAMVDAMGVLDTDDRHLAKPMTKAYLRNGGDDWEGGQTRRALTCTPRFVGVWDTVGALGLLIRLHKFDNNRLSPGVNRAAHALAIDERRSRFKPSLWEENELESDQSVAQVWFVGVHSDVGGGYARRDLADITLSWMLEQAEAAGLALKPNAYEGLQGDPAGHLHHSYRGAWWLLGRDVRYPGVKARFHESVAKRLACVREYNPPNLVREVCKGFSTVRGNGVEPLSTIMISDQWPLDEAKG